MEWVAGASGRLPRFGRLQCHFDNTGDFECDLVLQSENISERTIKAIAPDMGADDCTESDGPSFVRRVLS